LCRGHPDLERFHQGAVASAIGTIPTITDSP